MDPLSIYFYDTQLNKRLYNKKIPNLFKVKKISFNTGPLLVLWEKTL